MSETPAHRVMNWRLILSPPMSGAANMALDEALMVAARERGVGTVRVYSWSGPTISFGRHQRVAGRFDEAAAARQGVDFVRRITGGRALVHEREITYSVARPVTGAGALRAAYDRINLALLEALKALGVPAEQAGPSGRLSAPGDASCFARPVAGEVVVNGAKLAGSAQVRGGGALLQHGSILVDDDQGRLGALSSGARLPLPATATLRGALGRVVEPRELADALFDVVRRSWEEEMTRSCPDDDDLRTANVLLPRYRDASWTWHGRV